MKNNKGVTLTTLVIVIIVLIILASVTIYTSFEIYNTAKANKFKAVMQTIQERVNVECDRFSANGMSVEEYLTTGGFIFAKDAPKDIKQMPVTMALRQMGININLDEYVYLNQNMLKTNLGLEGIEEEVIINFYTREVISLNGVKFNNEMYYRIQDISKEYNNIFYTPSTTPDNTDTEIEGVVKRNYGINTVIEAVNENINELYIGECILNNETNEINSIISWEPINSYNRTYTTTITKSGTYKLKAILKDGTICEQRFDIALCNPPELSDGMVPVIWVEDETSEFGGYWKSIDTSNLDELGQWYDYADKKWANIMLQDGIIENENGQIEKEGSMFVWIPRFMYQITKYNNDDTTGYQTENAGNINIKFILGNTNIPSDKSNIKISKLAGNDNWIVHPCFQNGTSNNFKNGEWDKEINGIWVAKYPAGYQANTITYDGETLSTTISNQDDEIEYSSKTYTSYEEEDYLGSNSVGQNIPKVETNGLGQDLTSTGYATSKIPYPVFKPLTYTFNIISTGDSYVISQEVAKATTFYGLKENQINSHLMKNSEWGAVAYLTHSKYGRNREEVNINNYYTSIEAPFRTALTGVYAQETGATSTNVISNVHAYNTEIGNKGSSTGNITGIFDLSGCVWERVSSYIPNGNKYLKKYGNTFAYTEEDENAYKNKSTKYSTVYPFQQDDSHINNYLAYKNCGYGYGDAILAVSTNGEGTGWNSDYSVYPNIEATFFVRGGAYYSGANAGIFSSYSTYGYSRAYYSGFRVVLINS